MVVLATKCYVEGDARDRALDGMGSLVANDVGELAVDWQVGVRDDGFVQVDVTGEDAAVARTVLAETWGEIVAHDEGLTAGEEYERTHEFYLCEVCSIRFEFGEAMDFGFECPECGSPVEAMDNDRLREAMERRLEELREELNVDVTG